jgi:hypothetical protein
MRRAHRPTRVAQLSVNHSFFCMILDAVYSKRIHMRVRKELVRVTPAKIQ